MTGFLGLKGARHPYVGRSITMSLDMCNVILSNVDFLRFVVLSMNQIFDNSQYYTVST